MSPMGPSPSFTGGWSRIWRNSGSRYASVFPEPVLATAMHSRPDMIVGMACVTGGKQTHLTLNGERLLIAQLCDHVHDLLVQTALAPRENRTRIMLSANHHAPLLADGSHLLLAMRERNGCHLRHLGDQRRLDVEVLADGNVVDLRMVHGLRSNVSQTPTSRIFRWIFFCSCSSAVSSVSWSMYSST